MVLDIEILDAFPCPACVQCRPDAVTWRGIAANVRLATADPDDVRIRFAHLHGADCSPEIPIGHWRPTEPSIDGLEHTAAGRAHPVLVLARRAAGDGDRPAAAERTDFAPTDSVERQRVHGLRLRNG